MSLNKHGTGSWIDDADPGEPSTGKPRWSVTDEEAEILRRLASGLRVLEIGTGLGVSTRAMAETAFSVTTIDVDPWVHANVWPTLGPIVRCRVSIPPIWPERFDLAFIDGDHSAEAVTRDIKAVAPLLERNGVIALHDVHYKTVSDAVKAIGPFELVGSTTHGIGIMRRADAWRSR